MKKNVVIVVLVLLVVGLGGYLVYDKVINKDIVNNKKQNKVENKSIKLDNSKNYVYDAEYKYSNKYTELEEELGSSTNDGFNIKESNKLSDLKVPYININTDEAKEINKKLENLYLEYAKKFDELVLCDENENYPCVVSVLTYKTYYTTDTVSVIVIYGSHATDVYHPNYLGYTFDLKTGKLLTIDEIANLNNLNRSQLLDKTKIAIENYTKNSDSYDENTEFLNEDYEYIKNNINLNGKLLIEDSGIYTGLVYFIDSDNKINLITKLEVAAQAGYKSQLIILN